VSQTNPVNKAFSVSTLCVTVVLVIILLLSIATLEGLRGNNVSFRSPEIVYRNGTPILSANVSIRDPGPLPLDNVAAGLSLSSQPSLRLSEYRGGFNVEPGANVSLVVNLAIQPNPQSACVLLFHGENVGLGVLFNATVGGILPFSLANSTSIYFGALLGNLSVSLNEEYASPTGTAYTASYSYTDYNQYISLNTTIIISAGANQTYSIPVSAYPAQHVSGSKTIVVTGAAPLRFTVYVATLWGEYTLSEVGPQTYTGDINCG
jgi:hypothetical protein